MLSMRSRISEYSVNAASTQGRERGSSNSMPVRANLVDPTGGGMLLGQRTAHPGIGALVGLAPQQQVAVDAVGGQFVGGQIYPAASQVLVDVAQKVRELEGFSQRGGVRCGFVARNRRCRAPAASAARSPRPSRACSAPTRPGPGSRSRSGPSASTSGSRRTSPRGCRTCAPCAPLPAARDRRRSPGSGQAD